MEYQWAHIAIEGSTLAYLVAFLDKARCNIGRHAGSLVPPVEVGKG